MTKEELAKQLDGRQYRSEITKEECDIAAEYGVVVAFGASDDLMEFRGAIHGEIGCYDGGVVYLNEDGLFDEYEEHCDCIDYKRAQKRCDTIEAIWCPPDGGSWACKTDIPHATFKIFEDNELYCTGIVFETVALANG